MSASSFVMSDANFNHDLHAWMRFFFVSDARCFQTFDKSEMNSQGYEKVLSLKISILRFFFFLLFQVE